MVIGSKEVPNSVSGAMDSLSEQYRTEIKLISEQPENVGLTGLPAELYPFMSERELRAAILLSTHTKGIQWGMGLIFKGSLASEENTVSLQDGVYAFGSNDYTNAGVSLEIAGSWFVNSGFGNVPLGSGFLTLYVKERGDKDNKFSPLLGESQYFSIFLNRAEEGDQPSGQVIVNPEKWSLFIRQLSLTTQRTIAFSFNQCIACSPGYDWELQTGKSFCMGQIYSVGGSNFSIRSGFPYAAPISYTADTYTLVIRKPNFIEQGLIEFVKNTNGVDDEAAKKILMKLPADDYGWISIYYSARDMAIDYVKLKELGVDAKVSLDTFEGK